MRVLILCTGNSCRSQMAHGYLQSFDENIAVCSAGTIPAKEINSYAVQVMKEVGIDISNHTPKLVDKYLKDEWDYLITVCDNANETCPAFLGKVKHRMHIGIEDPSHAKGTADSIIKQFRRIRDEIKLKFYEFYVTILF
jgi:arsenate reductase (thioredoxin)